MTTPLRHVAHSADASLAARVKPFAPGGRKDKDRLADVEKAAASVGIAADLDALLAANPGLCGFLSAVIGASPFLHGLMREDPSRLHAVLAAAPDERFQALLAHVGQLGRASDEAALGRMLRRARAEVALLVALADLGGVWDLEQVTASLSAFADAAVKAGVAFLLAREHAAGRLGAAEPGDPAKDSGFIVLAMGKHGAAELNYSSDIDLIVLYDRAKVRLGEAVEPSIFFVRLTQRLVKLLQERTEDGYVFRVDLRLRPDPGSTSVAISTDAALRYYESRGQNWERAAFIKARAVAGDIAAGETFLAELSPFIWRKYLDYAAIADIHSIKRQIHDFRGHGEIAVAGHNLKLGRGGIREIEFFVQTQQLIAGGRNPGLRGRQTLAMLAALAHETWIAPQGAADLAKAYRFLRAVEHRLQMVADEQVHTLPEDEPSLLAVARLAGFAGVAAFAKALTATLTTVQHHYARLFESAPSLGAAGGSLVFTGTSDDPETLATLSRLGFTRPAAIADTIRGWHFGRYGAMRSAAARERLTEFLPALLAAFAATGDADAAFIGFDRFLEKLPSGVQLFSLLSANPTLLSLLATIMGGAPRLAEVIIRRPHVLDLLIDPAFTGGLLDGATLRARLGVVLAAAPTYEAVLDRARAFAQEQSFLIGARILSGTLDARRAGRFYADLADAIAAALVEQVTVEFQHRHGKLAGGRFLVVALGKWGGREMTAASDLDLMTVYDFGAGAEASSGPKPLAASQYYARLTQRLVAALSAPTVEGNLYEVDLRLRPSGSAGPVAVSLDAFVSYQRNDAWTWEHMALTRARVVAGDPSLAREVEAAAGAVLAAPRDAASVRADVLEMRGLLEGEKGGAGRWDLKQAQGGMVDIEFIAQFLQLTRAAGDPAILKVETEAALVEASRLGVLPKSEADVLLSALRLYQSLVAVIRLCVEGRFEPKSAPKDLLDLLSRVTELSDFPTLDAHVRDTEKAVRASFVRLIGEVPVTSRRSVAGGRASGAMQTDVEI